MKRILLACFLFTATCTPSLIQHAAAQVTAPTHTSPADFTAKINLLDSYIAANDMTNAQATWTQVHSMMTNTLAVSKYSIYTAASPADKSSHEATLATQTDTYHQVWTLKDNMIANRVELHNKLVAFGATIY